ncbi:hypothetical protein KKF34_16880 [Myxococcota bacterium]|nr:hypothetical protein [Myxococcota bacterium]MBU1381987.1 hypothetical protein [Myxococcota bacterium]MBU1498554.1 hypothetical protein [Myxococcota bacterium]
MQKIISLVVLLFLSSCTVTSVSWINAGEFDHAKNETIKKKFEDQFSKVKYDTSGIKIYVKFLPPGLEYKDNVYRIAKGYPGEILGSFNLQCKLGREEYIKQIKKLAAIVGGDIVFGNFASGFTGVVIKTFKEVKPVKKVEKTAEEKAFEADK